MVESGIVLSKTGNNLRNWSQKGLQSAPVCEHSLAGKLCIQMSSCFVVGWITLKLQHERR